VINREEGEVSSPCVLSLHSYSEFQTLLLLPALLPQFVIKPEQNRHKQSKHICSTGRMTTPKLAPTRSSLCPILCELLLLCAEIESTHPLCPQLFLWFFYLLSETEVGDGGHHGLSHFTVPSYSRSLVKTKGRKPRSHGEAMWRHSVQ
jgi:hypothetical protein